MINAIVAQRNSDGGIGYGDQLPWHIPSDLGFFKQMTSGCPIIMGYNTMLSLGRPLPNRTNIVIVRDQTDVSELSGGFHYCTVEECIDLAKKLSESDTVWVIGGAKTYDLFKDVIDEWYITYVSAPDAQCDVFFKPDLIRFSFDDHATANAAEISPPQSGELEYERKVYARRVPLSYIPFSIHPVNVNDDLLLATNINFDEFYRLFGALCNHVTLNHPEHSRYHNSKHLVRCAFLMFSLYNHFHPSDEEGPSRESILLTIAMLFHDYFHRNEKDDSKNIEAAMESFQYVESKFPELFDPIQGLTEQEVGNICWAICTTHYDFDNPYPNPPGANKNDIKYFSWMRDIDQLYVPAYFNAEIFDDLYEDIGKRFGHSYEGFISRNIAYYEGLRFYTEEISGIFKDIIGKVKNEHLSLTNKS